MGKGRGREGSGVNGDRKKKRKWQRKGGRGKEALQGRKQKWHKELEITENREIKGAKKTMTVEILRGQGVK